MKNLILILLLILISYPIKAQDKTLISGEIESGGYGGPLLQVGQVYGESGILVGGQGGWIINHRFVIGGKGYGLANAIDIEGSQNLKLEFGCGGALLEYIINSDQMLHYSIQSMIGAGNIRFAVKDHEDNHDNVNYNDDVFFVLEPGVNVILNVSKGLRVGAGATYRYVSGVEYEKISNS